MMKKLLVLALVLSVVGLANASLVVFDKNATAASFNAAAGTVSVIGVVGGDTNVGIISDAAVVTQLTSALGAAMPTDASGYFFNASDLSIVAPTIANDGAIWAIGTYLASGVYPTVQGGTILTANVGKACNKIFVFECDGDGNLLQGTTIVPEPMTMVLLGLGGLFLRKKK
jgi:hypothetical protein